MIIGSYVLIEEARLMRLATLVAACILVVGTGRAAAQTVIVRGMPAGSPLELVLNSTSVGSAKADENGDATIPLNLFANTTGKTETDAHVHVEVCADKRRVLVVERGSPTPPLEAGCERRDITGIFLLRRRTTVVVNLAGANPSLLLVQGRYSLTPEGPSAFWPPAPSGFVLSGSAGMAKFRDVLLTACGDVAECEGGGYGLTFGAAATYWISPYVAAEVNYVRPQKVSIRGGEGSFTFNSFLDAHVVSVVGKIGVPARSARIYGQVGGNYHQATFGTSQTMQDVTITIGGVETIVPGGTQNFQQKTAGWGWVFGGGVEVWISRHFATYGEFGRASLKGKALDDEDGEFDDALTSFVVGAKIRLGK
jgi:hypothetical protein